MIDRIELIHVLNSKEDIFPILSSLDECERLANSLLDIIESAKNIEDALSSRSRIGNEDAIYDIQANITHICYHLLDSDLLRGFLELEISGRFPHVRLSSKR